MEGGGAVVDVSVVDVAVVAYNAMVAVGEEDTTTTPHIGSSEIVLGR